MALVYVIITYFIRKPDDEDGESVDSDFPLIRFTSSKQEEQQSSGDECVAVDDSVIQTVDDKVINHGTMLEICSHSRFTLVLLWKCTCIHKMGTE